jgi:endoglucanase
MKRRIFIAIVIVFTLSLLWAVKSQADDNDELYTLKIYDKNMVGNKQFWEDSWLGYGGACNLDNASDRVEVVDDSLDRVLYLGGNLEHNGGWWLLCIARPMWQVISLDEPFNDTYLEFDVKVEGLNKDILFGIADKTRLKKEALLPLNDYIKPDGNWQKVIVPVDDFITAKSSIDLSKISHIIFRNTDSTGDFKLYISNMSFKCPFKEKNYPLIKINQLGYKLQEKKIAKISGLNIKKYNKKSFQIIDIENNKIAFQGKLKKQKDFDEVSGDTVYNADFSSLCEPGTYRIDVNDSSEVSSQFIISDEVYRPLMIDSLRMFYFQRCGCSITSPFSNKWQHEVCHDKDAFLLSARENKVEATGGWHDAGDYGKYIVNGGISVGTLLAAYEFMPDKFTDGQLNIPESSNQIPDILDEARYELEWFLKMQREDGGVYHKIAGVYEVNWKTPDKDKAKRYIIDLSAIEPNTDINYTESIVSTTATANLAAVCAMAARIYKDCDKDFAEKCLQAAEKAWAFLEVKESDYPKRGFCNPTLPDLFIVSGEYGDDPEGEWSEGDADERFWAAAELFRSTGKVKYHNYIKKNYNNFKEGHSLNWQQLQNYGLYAYCLSDNADINIKKDILKFFRIYIDDLVEVCKNNGYNTALHQYDYYWGSNAVILNNAIDLLYACKLFQDDEFSEIALNQLHYILGRNVFSYSFVSGAGEMGVKKYYHMWFMAGHYADYPPGFLVAGPNSDNYKVSKYPARCYGLNESDFTINEIAINYNAPLVFVSSFFSK